MKVYIYNNSIIIHIERRGNVVIGCNESCHHPYYAFAVPNYIFLTKFQENTFFFFSIMNKNCNSSSPLKVEGFYGESESSGEEHAKTDHHQTSNAQEIMSEPELIFQQLFYRHCLNSISKLH